MLEAGILGHRPNLNEDDLILGSPQRSLREITRCGARLGGRARALWYLYDLILVSGGSFRDAEGRLVSKWDPEEPSRRPTELAEEVLDELSALRSEVAELAERLDFAERLLAQPRPADSEPISTLKA
jgi:hypothetical protein